MISLLSSVQTCKVNTGYANKNQSDRFENPNAMLCHVWNGLDSYGRAVSYDSYYTKTPGCSSALDRVVVENVQRPQYIDYIPLDASGYLNPSSLGAPVSSKESFQKQTSLLNLQESKNTNMQGGSVGLQMSNTVRPYTTGQDCGMNGGKCTNALNKYSSFSMNQAPVRENYVDTRANQNFQDRRNLSDISGWKSNCYACSAGNR